MNDAKLYLPVDIVNFYGKFYGRFNNNADLPSLRASRPGPPVPKTHATEPSIQSINTIKGIE
jgi:hypothetical protein